MARFELSHADGVGLTAAPRLRRGRLDPCTGALDPRNRRFASLTNAVLRRLSREKASHLTATRAVSVIPAWFHERLVAVYGKEHAARIGEALLEPSAIDLTVKSDPEG